MRLHFAEPTYTAAGARKFNVKISGTQVLTNFDVYSTAGNKRFQAVVKEWNAQTNSSGQMVVQFIKGSADYPICSGIEIMRTTVYQINCGGPAKESFSADACYTGGYSVEETQTTIVTSGVSNAAPMAIYQSRRQGDEVGDPDIPAITYYFEGLMPNAAYKVRLHFAETEATAAGQRVFGVQLINNGVISTSDLDIYSLSGQKKALVKDFSTTADAEGMCYIDVVIIDNNLLKPLICGIEVLLN